eukprot:CAMPEP_0113487276 /NCGR_PEP_ID=MMETSP0014_2-20120614/25425_1 /TAXON_ID=2857 /ORGANISM="Nitzschia sp." /LENGTH=616 /DNA_ID=CAMNT_0000380967 /DNA_START=391 /DNA_END=2238 /DNA_ORIENTATION=- /assembly_acc=CAM_ASM_000159
MAQQNGGGSNNRPSIRNRNGSSINSTGRGRGGPGPGPGPYSSSSQSIPRSSSATSTASASSRGVRFEQGTMFLDGGSSNNDNNNNNMNGSNNGTGGSNNYFYYDATTFADNDVVRFLKDVFYAALAFQCFLGLMTVVVFLYLIVRPFSVTVYRRLVNQIGLGSYIEAVSLLLPSTRICLTGDSDVPSPVGTSILVSNHVMDADWYSVLMLGRGVGLRGSVKVFLRNEFLHLNKGTTTTNNNSSPRGSLSTTWNNNNNNNNNGNSNASLASNGSGGSNNSSSNNNTSRQQLNQIGSMWSSITSSTRQSNNSINPSGSSNSIVLNGGGPASALSTTTTPGTAATTKPHEPAAIDLRLVAAFLRSFMEFPLIDEEDYVSDRESLFELLRSFATNDQNGAASAAPVHFLLYPEGWSLYNGENRNSVLARSNEFARREGRPQLKHLLLPRTTGFNASISCLRESNPVVYDMTVAYKGYDGSIPTKGDLSIFSLWNLLRRNYPSEVHIRMKRYSMEEVLQDASWLDKQWAEKDRLLDYFSKHNTFPVDRRGFSRHRVFESRMQSMETSIMSLVRLLLLPCAVPILIFLSIPILWTTFWAWLFYQGYRYVMNVDTTNTTSPAA